ncbi:MAG TPA: hypothetical protein VGY96_21735 [Streptosporangiaceae bacterium]|nr:hypothetical protein [Streptosporangiaceae bacterium]
MELADLAGPEDLAVLEDGGREFRPRLRGNRSAPVASRDLPGRTLK